MARGGCQGGLSQLAKAVGRTGPRRRLRADRSVAELRKGPRCDHGPEHGTTPGPVRGKPTLDLREECRSGPCGALGMPARHSDHRCFRSCSGLPRAEVEGPRYAHCRRIPWGRRPGFAASEDQAPGLRWGRGVHLHRWVHSSGSRAERPRDCRRANQAAGPSASDSCGRRIACGQYPVREQDPASGSGSGSRRSDMLGGPVE